MHVYRTIGVNSKTNLNISIVEIDQKNCGDIWMTGGTGRTPRITPTSMYFDTLEEANGFLETLLIDRLSRAEEEGRFLAESINQLRISRERSLLLRAEGEG